MKAAIVNQRSRSFAATKYESKETYKTRKNDDNNNKKKVERGSPYFTCSKNEFPRERYSMSML